MKLIGRVLPFSPAFLGYVESKRGSHVYFFENLGSGFATLESGLNSAIICPRIITDIVRKSASLFRTIYGCGFVYTDFCTKNIMIERDTGAIAIIDVDSCVPVELLLKPEKLKARGQEEFWGQRIDVVEFINFLAVQKASAETRKRKLASIEGCAGTQENGDDVQVCASGQNQSTTRDGGGRVVKGDQRSSR